MSKEIAHDLELEDVTGKISEYAHMLAFPQFYDVEETNIALQFFMDNGLTLENTEPPRVMYTRMDGSKFLIATCDF